MSISKMISFSSGTNAPGLTVLLSLGCGFTQRALGIVSPGRALPLFGVKCLRLTLVVKMAPISILIGFTRISSFLSSVSLANDL